MPNPPPAWVPTTEQLRELVTRPPSSFVVGVDWGAGESYTVYDEVSPLVNPRTVLDLVNVDGVWRRP